MQLISDITTETKRWAVRITVIEDIPAITCYNGKKLKRYIFADAEGHEVIGSIYGRDVSVLAPMIHVFNVYDISNAEVTTTPPKYQILANPLQWNIRRETLISPVPDAVPNLTRFLESITPFSTIMANNANISSADIMGIVLHAEEIKYVNNGESKVQSFTFANMEKIPMCVSLWDEMVDSVGHILSHAARTNAVVVAKRLAIKTFNCISLASKNSTSFAVDPPVEATDQLKLWFRTLPQIEINNLRNYKCATDTRNYVLTGQMKIHTVAGVLKQTQMGHYWIKGYLMLKDLDQQLYYIACSGCSTKVKNDIGEQYTCFICKEKTIAAIRPIVALSVADHTAMTTVVAMESIAERILQTTTDNMARLLSLGERLELETVNAGLQGKTFIMLLRRNFRRDADPQRRLILDDYYEDTTPRTAAHPNYLASSSSSQSQDADYSISPLKHQMKEVSIDSGSSAHKMLQWNKDALMTDESTDNLQETAP